MPFEVFTGFSEADISSLGEGNMNQYRTSPPLDRSMTTPDLMAGDVVEVPRKSYRTTTMEAANRVYETVSHDIIDLPSRTANIGGVVLTLSAREYAGIARIANKALGRWLRERISSLAQPREKTRAEAGLGASSAGGSEGSGVHSLSQLSPSDLADSGVRAVPSVPESPPNRRRRGRPRKDVSSGAGTL